MTAIVASPLDNSIDNMTCSTLADILSRAFVDDLGMKFLCQVEKAGYETRLYRWFLATLKMQITSQQPLFTLEDNGEIVAVAILTSPSAKLNQLALLRWLLGTMIQVGAKSVSRTLTHLQHLQKFQPKEPFYALEFIAVDPNYQGKGYGKTLIQQIHQFAKADTNATGIWLETANPVNVPFYERLGYRQTNLTQIGKSDIDAFIMFRER